MLKVLIADDETKVIQLIEHLVNWSDFDMEIIDRVNDGRKALSVILEKKPDVVVTDIRMPVVSGIELVEKAHEGGVSPYFIIISGFSEFEYAQRAIQMGVEDYLLKPLKRKELETVLNKIREKYLLSRQTDEEKTDLLDQLEKSRSRARSSLLTDILAKQNTAAYTMSDEELYKEYGCRLDGVLTECLVTHLFTGNVGGPSEVSDEYGFILPKFLDALESRLSECCLTVISTVIGSEAVTLINHNADDMPCVLEELRKLKINILNYRNIYPGLRIAVGMSKPLSSVRMIAESCRDAQAVLAGRFFDEDGFVFQSDSYFPPVSETADFFTPADRKALLQKIEFIDADACAGLLAEDLERLISTGRTASVRDGYISLCGTLQYGISALEDLPGEAKSRVSSLADAFDCLYTFDEIKQYMIRTCSDILRDYAEMRNSIEDKPIRRARQYIQEHYSEALSLEAVSSEVGFNPAYFSTVFKKSTGQNFMDYVKEVRIANARELLTHTDLDVAQVATAVGYTDIKYFSRLFRKLTQLTPTDYRKLYG